MFYVPVQNAVANLQAVAGELCKLARVTGPEFPHPLLSSRTLPASDWPVPRGAVYKTVPARFLYHVLKSRLVNPTFSPESTC